MGGGVSFVGGTELLRKRAEQNDDLESTSRRLLAQLDQLEREQRAVNLRDPDAVEEYRRRVESLKGQVKRLRSDQ
jgi:hypothetical protein